MHNLNTRTLVSSSKVKAILVFTLTMFISSSALAKIKHVENIYTQEGYPYSALVQRADEVKLIFTEQENSVNCRVEVSQNGKVWRGLAHTAKTKKFQNKPLHSCMDRDIAKNLLAETY